MELGADFAAEETEAKRRKERLPSSSYGIRICTYAVDKLIWKRRKAKGDTLEYFVRRLCAHTTASSTLHWDARGICDARSRNSRVFL